MPRRPKPDYTPVDPAPAELPPEDVWSDGAMTLKQAAAFLGRKATFARELVRRNCVPANRDGREILVARRGLVLYLIALPDEAASRPAEQPKGSFLPGRERK